MPELRPPRHGSTAIGARNLSGTRHRPAPPELDPDDPIGARNPNTARIWNYQLGGTDNFAVDREAAEAANARIRALVCRPAWARPWRAAICCSGWSTTWSGVRQILDLGSGLPNMANTHQIAHRSAPGARVVYVDIDPMVSSHAAALMAGPSVVTLWADLREPEQVLGNAQVRGLLDFGQPVGIMFMCVLQCLWDREDPWGVVRQFWDAVAPGSYLALSHMTDEAHPEAAKKLFRMTQQLHWNTPLISRSRADIARFFDGSRWLSPAWWLPPSGDPIWTISSASEGEPTAAPDPCSSRSPRPAEDARGVAWHLCGIGIKDQQ